MKIGLIAPGGFDRGGQERVIPVFLGFVERLARRHEVHVVTLYQYAEPQTYPLLGATVQDLGHVAGRNPAGETLRRGLRLLKAEHRRGRFDALHGLWATQSGLLTTLAGRLLRVPTVVTVAGGELVALPAIGYGAQLSRRGRGLVRVTLRLANAVTTASEYMMRPLRQRRPDARQIVFGVDCERFRPPPAPSDRGTGRLLHVASLNRVKDQATLLRAFARLHREASDLRLDIIGEDTLNGAMQKLACELGLREAVTFHGFQPGHVVACRLPQSDLLFHSALSEVGPMAFLEAAACGVPTVGTAVGLIADVAPAAAVAVPVGDADALACAALGLWRDSARRAVVAASALDFARAHDADWTARQFETLYAELALRNRTP